MSASPPWAQHRRWWLLAGVAVHVTLFVLHARAGGAPFGGGWLTVSGVALAVTLMHGAVTLRSPQPTVGAILYALVFTMQFLASGFGPMAPVAPTSAVTAVSYVHVSTSLLAAAALLLSGVYGALHLLLYRQMHRKQFGPLFSQLPNLDVLARSMRRAALAGFLLMTTGLNVGIGLAHARGSEGFGYTDPHVVLLIALWVHFGIVAFSRRIPGLTARRAAFAAFGGLVTLLIAISLLTLPGATFHSFS